jgi:hypothetical protein
MSNITINMVGTSRTEVKKVITPAPVPAPTPVHHKKGGKTLKTFPKGILKTSKNKFHLKATTNPSKPPPLKKSMERHTIRILTEKGAKHHRKTLKKKISKMSNEKVKHLVLGSGLLKNPETPPAIMREILEGGAIAGFVSLN